MKNLIIGVGNLYRSDDGVGLIIAREIKERLKDSVDVIEQSGEGLSLMESWKDREKVFIIDAVCSGAHCGAIFRLDASNQIIPQKFFNYSTHAFSVAEAIELARTLNQLPNEIIIYGIEGKNFAAGTNLSPQIEKASHEVIIRLMEELRTDLTD